MSSGKRRHLIVIQRSVKVKSASGAATETWIDFASTWAKIETMRGYEKQSAQAAWPGADSRINIRYVAGILPTMRIVYNNKIYSIISPNDIEERHREIELICQSGVLAS